MFGWFWKVTPESEPEFYKTTIKGKDYRICSKTGRFVDINTVDDLPEDLDIKDVPGVSFVEFARWQMILYNELIKNAKQRS